MVIKRDANYKITDEEFEIPYHKNPELDERLTNRINKVVSVLEKLPSHKRWWDGEALFWQVRQMVLLEDEWDKMTRVIDHMLFILSDYDSYRKMLGDRTKIGDQLAKVHKNLGLTAKQLSNLDRSSVAIEGDYDKAIENWNEMIQSEEENA